MSNDTHYVEIRSGTAPSGRKQYAAHCSCGYAGKPEPSARQAEDDGDEHVIAMSRAE